MSRENSRRPDGRDIIMTRIREASALAGFKRVAPMPAQNGRAGLPRDFPARGERIAAFAQRMEELHISFVLCDSADDITDGISTLALRSGWKNIAVLSSDIAEAAVAGVPDRIRRAGPGLDRKLLGSCEAGVIAADAADAQTGAILVAGGTELTAVVPTLVVIAPAERLAGSLDEALASLKHGRDGTLPPSVSMITGGPVTETGERRRVPGGHGPRSIIVYLVMPA